MEIVKKSAFFFDLDNTLFNYEASFKQASLFAFRSIISPLINHKICAEKWFECYKTYCDALWPAYENGTFTRSQYQKQRLVSSLKSFQIYGFDDRHLLEYQNLIEMKIPTFVKPFPWINEIMSLVRTNENEVGVISNGKSDLQRRKLKQLGLDLSYLHIYISSEINLAKPSPEIFDYVSAMCPAKKYYYVGDSLGLDILPAIQAGWTGIWWNPEQQEFTRKSQFIHNCRSVTELKDVIKRYIE